MISDERRRQILQLLESQGAVSVADLGARFVVSEMTVRRDLDELERRGLLRRVHGGAVSVRGRSFEPAFLSRSGLCQNEKRRIAAAAVQMIQNGDSIAIDVGSTTLELARQLKDKRDLTVITPSLRVADQLAEAPGLRLMMTGGIVRPGELSLVGPLAEETFGQFFVDKLFLGIGGIDLEAGFTEYSLEDALVKRAMLRAAKETIVVADASKFGRVTFAAVAPLAAADFIITDDAVDPAFVDELAARKLQVLVV